ncbi:MAG: peptidylprolyl isomerase [Candidatus Eisenbacteria bacterium]|uniref:Peptidyl-prolyl cis-trans isomerase n=1 Tax=Eiseniibacteriota bacterium TaxID=2212470 RepID=A0A7Y2E6I4_UNCEI|nr:peptidylprolyl isomerase [Candidatus Eisenbacteria bacterium]
MDGDPGPETEVAVIKTNKGDVKIRFYPKVAPKTVANFKGLAAKDYYDGVTFHRVIKQFMIQGGDPTGTGRGGSSLWGGKFEDETDPSLTFSRPGLLAMANAGPNTNSSQFFITQVPTPHLNGKHTIFGEVMEGMDVVNAICAVPVGAGSKPTSPVVIQDVVIQ